MATATLDRTHEPLDTSIRLVTPERIAFQYPLAGPFRRALAYLLDLIFIALILVVALLVALLMSAFSVGSLALFLILMFGLQWFFRGFCEAIFNGQTPGKWATRIRVVSAAGVPITGGQAVLRNLLMLVEWIVPFGFLPALASMMLTRRFQRLGDLAADTMVIVEKRPPRGRMARVREPAVEAIAPLLPSVVAAGPELAQALSDYVGSRARFGRSRREEMAEHLARPLRLRYGLPETATADAVVCALYQRVFLGA